MVHQDEHLDHVGSCHCFCEQCHEPKGLDACVCEDCMCRLPADPLHPAYYGDHQDLEQKHSVQHLCRDCGQPVVRKGTRGRYPTRCPDCKTGQSAAPAAPGLF